MATSKTRAKFFVQTKTETKEGYQISLAAVVNNNEENASFFKYTPSGVINMSIVQEDAAKYFTPGKEYYVDFTEAK